MMKSLCYLIYLMPVVLAENICEKRSSIVYQDYTADEWVESQESTWGNTEKCVLFYTSNRQNRDLQRVLPSEVENITGVSSFNISLKTIFLIHGWKSVYNSTYNLMLGNAYLDVRDVNIIYIDWDKWANIFYPISVYLLSRVGEYIGQFINEISATFNYSLENIELVGHSLGAHICGYVGGATNSAISSITGLDPAKPGFSKYHPESRLSPDDAQYVQVIHTAGLMVGSSYTVGDADYIPNGGCTQPGCCLLKPICDHDRSYLYFIESLRSDQFIAKKCESYDDYLAGQYKNDPQIIMGGAAVNRTLFGKYCLKTNSTSPFALGDIGL
ncbi:lipoprotein lipase [Dendroctonus ponderosae]|uniref:lipoprotein lipase n=1 Tax=Dendroctonus ponderosae TaxID=77166 RepID=UPI002034B823|nr:lipoprotein lipase [Dendroctonus ponderosae]KAH1029408.1 hypothetical protein HUJ05_002657 [Dendroctonus ponderosae]